MQTDNRLFDDLARVATNAIGSLQTARGEASNRIRQQFERILESMDLVSREEFDTVKAMAQKARLENDKLAKRVAELESKLGLTAKTARKTSGKTAAARGASSESAADATTTRKAANPKATARRTKSAAKSPASGRSKASAKGKTKRRSTPTSRRRSTS